MIVFTNKGLIDLDAVATMGVSVKDGEQPIGYFGTGLKFAIATILRNGGEIMLYRDAVPHHFTLEKALIRGEEFDLVCLDGKRIGFTTQLGRDWEPWMAFRELASNCRDEGGRYLFAKPTARICDDHLRGQTVFIVSGMDDVWDARHSIMLESQPIAENSHIEVHEGINAFVFYRGVRIFQAPRPLAYTYNIKSTLTLSEDRQARSWFEIELALEMGVAALEDEAILRRVLTCGELFQEHHMDSPRWGSPSPKYNEMARSLALGPENVSANPKALAHARASALQDMRPGDGLVLSEVKKAMLLRAKWLLQKHGFEVEAFPIICVDSLGAHIHGLAKDGKIYLAAVAFEKGTRELAATIFEEYAHLKSGAQDATRDFQNWLIDRILIQIEDREGEAF